MECRQGEEALWRRRLSRELAGLIAIKLVALALLWWLFFSPVHRTAVDADIASRRLGMVAAPLDPAGAAPHRAQDAASD
jgi:uncharacterized membrane protein